MDFQTFCNKHFAGDEEKAIRCLVQEGIEKEYRCAGSPEGLQAILDTMDGEQTERYRQAMEKKEAEQRGTNRVGSWLLIAAAVFAVCFIVWMLVSGWNNLAIRRELRETGIPVTVTVTDKERVSGGENDYYDYTFTYTVEGTTYTVVDSPDHSYDVGDTFQEYVDPQHPEKLVLISDNLSGFFLLMGMILAWLLMMVNRKMKRYLVLGLAGL